MKMTKIIHIDNHALIDSHAELAKALQSMLRGNRKFETRWVTCPPTPHALNAAEIALVNAEKVFKVTKNRLTK